MEFEKLRELVVVVKPSLADHEIKPSESLVRDLGLDSLDLLQLGRKIQRTTGLSFVIGEWSSERVADGKALTIESLQAALVELGQAGA